MIFVVAIALALAVGTLLVASVASDALVQWLQSLPPQTIRLVQAVLSVLTVCLLVVGAYAHRKSGIDDGP